MQRGLFLNCCVLFSFISLHLAYGDVSYSIAEEMKRGSVIGNIGKDLGLGIATLSSRKARIDTDRNDKRYCDINLSTGDLIVADRIDREGLCGKKATCVLREELVLENPLELHRISIHVQDINDNAPHFRRGTMHLDISESSPVGERFSLNNAADPDVGTNSVKNYHLSSSEHFALEIQTGRDGSKFADLMLKRALDREQQAAHNLILTAVDGGVPTRTGKASINLLMGNALLLVHTAA